MRRFICLFVALSLLASCADKGSGEVEKPDKIPDTEEILEIPEQLEIEADGGNIAVKVKSNAGWTVLCDSDWIAVIPDHGYQDGEVVLKVTPNSGMLGREATVSFKTEHNSKDLLLRQKGAGDNAVSVDADGPANCFIVSPDSGICTFKAVIPGSSTQAAEAALVWQSAKELVSRVEYSTADQSVLFALNGKAGNALIAVKDESGNILWSWHIWVTDYDPGQNVLTTAPNEGGTSWTFMDRNLGALTASSDSFNALGLLYQWGRKDPFPGVVSEDEKEPEIFDIDGNILPAPAEKAEQFGTVDLAVSHPDVFYKISYNTKDWTTPSDDDLWGGVSYEKTIYDPCPAGWRVPVCDKNGLNPYEFLLGGDAVWSESPAGYFYETWWFPCAGTRVYESGSLSYNIGGGYGGMWVGTAGKANPDLEQFPTLYGQYLFLIDASFFGISKDARSQGMSIRCVKE